MIIQVTAADISLFHVAARYLGDATQWWRISQLNGISDPDLSRLTSPISVALPPQSATLTAGLPELVA